MKVRVLSAAAVVVLLAADAPKEAEVPELNKKVLEFARDKLGEKVGDGECATLVAQAFRAAGAKGLAMVEGEYVWGKLVRAVTPKSNMAGEVLPGDVLQFRDAVLVGRVGGGTMESTYSHHTAIVAAVKDGGRVVEVLHQNYGDFRSGDEERRKVQRTTLRFSDLKKGSVKIYRPQPRSEE
jgi:hypothetical protein